MNYSSPQGLASLGRNGDSMLVHMSPSEVAGLQGLAMSRGGSLTINPDTGLPEAFSLSGVFSSILPMFAGAMFPGAGFAMQPLLAGALTGGVLAKVQGKDPLMGGLMGGLGGISGSNLAQGLGGAAGATGSAVQGGGGYVPSLLQSGKQAVTQGAGIDNLINQGYNINTGLADKAVMNPALQSAMNTVQQTGGALPNTGSFLDKELTALSNAGTGAKNLITGQPGAWEGFKSAYGPTPLTNFQAATKIGMPVGGALLGGIEPSDIYGEPINMDEAKRKQRYDPYATLNLGNDTGLRLVAKGGYIDGYAQGGTITTGGLRDLYGTVDSATNPQLSRDGYGVGRLDSLAREQAMTQAQTTGYAMGGPVSFADGGITDEIAPIGESMGLTSLMPPATTPPASGQAMPTGQVQNAATALSDTASSDSSIIAQVANNLRTDPNYQPKNPIEASIVKQLKGTDQTQQPQQAQGLGSIAPSQPMAPSYTASQPIGPTYYAGMNAPRGFAEGGETSMNLDTLPSLNLNFAGAPSENKNMAPGSFMMDSRGPGYMMGSNPVLRAKMAFMKSNAAPTPASYALNLNTGKQEAQYAQGGYLDGQGDGMSDSIPATIEGKQPARLADGEFVIPADVVSHLGNGSSKAGSKRLYAMLDKVRHARTGNKKQGKEIKAEKYLPA